MRYTWLVLLTTIASSTVAFRTSWHLEAKSVLPQAADENAIDESIRDFIAINPIDSHTHERQNVPDLYGMLKRWHLHILNIVVVDDTVSNGSLEPQRTEALSVVRASDGHVTLCTTFDPYKLKDRDFANEAIKQINQDFTLGAVAVKLWKNVGMEIKRADGTFALPDDPIFEPIYKDIEEHHRTLITHVAEPDSCWIHPAADDQSYIGVLLRYALSYYKKHPEWDMSLHPERPSKDITPRGARPHPGDKSKSAHGGRAPW